MGVLNIRTGGSFPIRSKTFGAMEHGHAHAVIDALRWLTEEVLPAAVEQDMHLLEQGMCPRQGFYRNGGRA